MVARAALSSGIKSPWSNQYHGKNLFLGIMIGSASLALVASVMNGIEYATHEKLQGIHAPISIMSKGHLIDFDKIKEVIAQEFPQMKQ